jgi:hypothetical protein
MRAPAILIALLLSACGSNSSTPNDASSHGGDAALGDALEPIDAPSVPATLTLSGTTKEISAQGQTPTAGVVITAYNVADDSVLGTATSAGATATFAITVATNGHPIDGYLKAVTPGAFKQTFLYPPFSLTMDYANVPVFVMKSSTYDLVNQLLGNNQATTQGWIAMLALDGAQAAVAGATISSTPSGQIAYNSGGLPSASATSTAADGIGYDTAIAAGQVTVNAAKAGATFHSHAIKVRADVVTLTIVSE